MLCEECKEHYHSFTYPTCFNCLPSERKEEIKKGREFEKEMDEIMQNLEEALDDANETDLD